MKTLRKTQLGAETRVLNGMYGKYGRVNKAMQAELTKRGYVLCDLGTSKRCYTTSGAVGKKHFANNNEVYFGIGVYNIGKRCKSNGINVSVYRAWVKRIETTLETLQAKITEKLSDEVDFETIKFDGSDIYIDGKLEYQHNHGSDIRKAWAEESEGLCNPNEIDIEEYSSFGNHNFFCVEIDEDYWVYKL